MRRVAFCKTRLLLTLLALAACAEALYPAVSLTQPVLGATSRDWNPHSFWHAPWGVSGVHKAWTSSLTRAPQ